MTSSLFFFFLLFLIPYVVNVARRDEDNTLYSLLYGPNPEERTGL